MKLHEIVPGDVEAARTGDVAAYGRLVKATESLVRATVRGEIRDPGLADDAVQETYLHAFQKLDTLRDPAAFPAWLRSVATRVARNEARRRRPTFVDLDRWPVPQDESTDPDPTPLALAAALVRLGSSERRLIERTYRGRWSTARLAAAEGISLAAVRKRLQRVRDRLRKDIMMVIENGEHGDLPAKIVELLSRPVLLDLPENPVGAVWEMIRATRPDDEEFELPELLALADVGAFFGNEVLDLLPDCLHRVDDETILRFDLSVPLLLAARGRPDGTRLLTAGKVYRDEAPDLRRLKAFHQAEVIEIGPKRTVWGLMDWFEEALDRVLPGRPLRVLQVAYPLYSGSDRGYEVHVQDGSKWLEIAGFARATDHAVAALGLDPESTRVVSLGMGLERIACLKYGIDDVRTVSSRRV